MTGMGKNRQLSCIKENCTPKDAVNNMVMPVLLLGKHLSYFIKKSFFVFIGLWFEII
jgi:hypothetical protein